MVLNKNLLFSASFLFSYTVVCRTKNIYRKIGLSHKWEFQLSDSAMSYKRDVVQLIW